MHLLRFLCGVSTGREVPKLWGRAGCSSSPSRIETKQVSGFDRAGIQTIRLWTNSLTFRSNGRGETAARFLKIGDPRRSPKHYPPNFLRKVCDTKSLMSSTDHP